MKKKTKQKEPKKQKEPAKKGRPSKLEQFDPAIFEILYAHGLTDKMVAQVIGVTQQTINNWKKMNQAFFESLKEGKSVADGKVVVSLYRLATGYSHPEDKVFLGPKGEPVIVKTIKHYPPNATALIWWTRNRMPDKWRERKEVENVDDTGQLEEILRCLKNPYPETEGGEGAESDKDDSES